MNAYELLKTGESVLAACERNNVLTADIKYLPLYEDYTRLKGEGHKITWILSYLSQQYQVSEATIKRLSKRMKNRIK